MIRYPAKLIEKAKYLATNRNLSYKEIGRRLNISDSTIGIWFRNFPEINSRTYVKNSRKTRLGLKKSETDVLKGATINTSQAKIFCAIIYGCEGAKYPASNCVALTNSDPSLVVAFLSLLREGFRLNESKFRVILQIHSHQNYSKLLKFWSKILKIPEEKFYKPTITKAKEGKHRVGYQGTCTVKYYNYVLQLKLIGIFEAFMRKSSLLVESPSGRWQRVANPRLARDT